MLEHKNLFKNVSQRWSQIYTTRKNWRPRANHEGTIARWHQAHETYDGTRATKFSMFP